MKNENILLQCSHTTQNDDVSSNDFTHRDKTVFSKKKKKIKKSGRNSFKTVQ